MNDTSALDTISDSVLLEKFGETHDQTAFAELVRRHNNLVMSVCLRVLGNRHDAEDAFQATFLVLAQRCSKIKKKTSLPSWLYGVAYRVSINLGRKKHHREKSLTVEPMSVTDPFADLEHRFDQQVVDEELNRLPEKYRVALVQYYMKGQTSREIAEELGMTQGKIDGDIKRGRQELLGETVEGSDARFHPGASAEEINRCQTKNGWAFPSELVELLLHANGEEGTSVLRYSSLCSLDEMAHAHEMLLGIEANLLNESEDADLILNPCIARDRRWQRHWIPLAYSDDCANILFLDPKLERLLTTAIFPFTEDTIPRPPIATTLTELFESIEAFLRANADMPYLLDLPQLNLDSGGYRFCR